MYQVRKLFSFFIPYLFFIDNGVGIEVARLLVQSLKTNTTLETLNFRGVIHSRISSVILLNVIIDNELGVHGAQLLAEVLLANTTLKTLNLHGMVNPHTLCYLHKFQETDLEMKVCICCHYQFN